jgi:hypothetical protein
MLYDDKFLPELKQEMKIGINLVNGYPIENDEFNKSSFEEFAKAITKKLKPIKSKKIVEMGKSISWEIIRQIIMYEFHVKIPTDRKVEKTLSKICFYLGYDDWKDFKRQKEIGLSGNPKQIETIKLHLLQAIEKLNEFFANLYNTGYSQNLKTYIISTKVEKLLELAEELKSKNIDAGLIPRLTLSNIAVVSLAPTYATVYATECRSFKVNQLHSHSVYNLLNVGDRWVLGTRYYSKVALAISPLDPYE